MTDYKNNGLFLNPGVWLIGNSNDGAFPVFCSLKSLIITGYLNINDEIGYAIVLPGYKVIFYNAIQYFIEDSLPYIIDNTNGTEIKSCVLPKYALVNDVNTLVSLDAGLSSLRLFFEGTEIAEQINYVTLA
jgi:hypothetical protein